MINFLSDKKLSIILPNTNRALAEVLKSASPKELEEVTKGKDLKSIMNTLLKDSSKNAAADKVLLDLVKNNPTLKEIGSANQNIKDLLNTLRSDKNLLHVEKIIQKFLPDIKELKNLNMKSTIENSGVFLESKLKDIQDPKVKLRSMLTELSNIVEKSRIPVSKTINAQLKELLSSPMIKEASNNALTSTMKESPKELENLAKSIQSIVDKIKVELKSADPITTKEFSSKLNKLETLLEPKNLQNSDIKPSDIKESVKQIIETLQNSLTKESRRSLEFLNKSLTNIEVLEKSLNSSKAVQTPELQSDPKTLKTEQTLRAEQALHVKETPKALQELVKNIQNLVDKIKVELKSPEQTLSKDIHVNREIISGLEKLQNRLQTLFAEKHNPQIQTLQDSIKQVSITLQSTPLKDGASIIDALSKIFKPLQSIEQNINVTKGIHEQLLDKKIPQEIKTTINEIKTSIQNSDPLFSKPAKVIFDELSLLKGATKLSAEQNIKDLLSNDLKAVLNRASDEIAKLPTSSQSEITKQIDKLSLQIDYHQLVSHLSDASSLYIPFAWDGLEEGNISIKQAEQDKFYCDIDLKLKEYGELNLRLTIYEKNQLNIHIRSDSEELKEIIKENIPILRKALIETDITPREIRFFDKTKTDTSAYNSSGTDLDMGFEVKA